MLRGVEIDDSPFTGHAANFSPFLLQFGLPFLHGLGVPWDQCWTTAACGKGWWRMAHTPAAQPGMDNAWFQAQGLVNPLDWYLQLQH